MYYNLYYTPNEERWKWLSFDLPYNGEYLLLAVQLHLECKM
jgi:hypothetical protein